MTTDAGQGHMKLADGFPPATRAAWRSLVDKALKGADFDKRLVARTDDGVRIEPLYAPDDALPGIDRALPGKAPFVRGTTWARPGLGWDIRQFASGSDAKAVNAEILDDLAGGVASIALHVATPGGSGLAADAATLGTALDGVMLDMCGIALVAGEKAPEAAQGLLSIWHGRGIGKSARRGAFNADPIGTLAVSGGLARPLATALADAVALVGATADMPGVTALLADGVGYHSAGATEAQELAAMLATFVAYLRAAEAAGIAPAAAAPKIAVALAADTDQFLTIAKLRAARHLLWRLLDAAGAGASAGKLHVTAVTSWRMLAKRDPWTNILRNTIACAGAALGGADAITVLPFTFVLGKTDNFARRVSRNIQIVCQEESHLGVVADPAGGSWYMERLTRDLAEKAWGLFQAIEGKGGIAAALAAGELQADIAAKAAERARAIATGRIPLTGVSAFPLLGEDGLALAPWETGTPAPAKSAVTVPPLRLARLAAPFEALRDAADAHAAKTGKPLHVFLASLGAVIDHNARSTWIKNYLAAGGIAADMSDGYPDAAAAAKAFKASGAGAACICSSDAVYANHAEATAKALKAAGARLVLMAGRPGDREPALKAAGVDQFLYAGADAVATLGDLQAKLAIGHELAANPS